MAEKMIPIIENCDGKNELVTPNGFASHVPEAFSEIEYVKSLGVHRCYIIFYDAPERNKFLKKLKKVFVFHGASCSTPVYLYKKALIAIAMLGAPAAASLMEELSIFGIDEFIAMGSAGCLDEKVKSKIVLVEKAIRDEGTSYHYVKPSTYALTNKELNKEIEAYLKKNYFDFLKSITWTNDAYYRETKQKVEMAQSLGAVAVEMECSAWCSVAKYRGYKFAQMLYFSDLVKQEAWTRLIKHTKGYHNEKRDVVLTIVIDMVNEYSK